MSLHHHRNKFIRKHPRHTQHCFLHYSVMFRMVWRPTVAGVFDACVLEFYLILISVTLSFFLYPHLGPYVFLAYSLQASRDIIPFLIWLDFLPSAFSFRIPSVDNFFFSFPTFHLSSSHMRLILIFGPQNLIPPHLTFYFSDTTRYHGPHLKKCLCVCLFVFISFVSRYLPAFWHRRDGILIGMG